jgi:hypothetical protein
MRNILKMESLKGFTYYPSFNNETPVFTPKKHKVESYRSQQRRAKKNRNNRQKR